MQKKRVSHIEAHLIVQNRSHVIQNPLTITYIICIALFQSDVPTARVFPVLVGDGSVLVTPGVLMVKAVPQRASAVEVVQSLLADHIGYVIRAHACVRTTSQTQQLRLMAVRP